MDYVGEQVDYWGIMRERRIISGEERIIRKEDDYEGEGRIMRGREELSGGREGL